MDGYLKTRRILFPIFRFEDCVEDSFKNDCLFAIFVVSIIVKNIQKLHGNIVNGLSVINEGKSLVDQFFFNKVSFSNKKIF